MDSSRGQRFYKLTKIVKCTRFVKGGWLVCSFLCCVCVTVHLYTFVYICVSVYICVCVTVCACVYIYIFISCHYCEHTSCFNYNQLLLCVSAISVTCLLNSLCESAYFHCLIYCHNFTVFINMDICLLLFPVFYLEPHVIFHPPPLKPILLWTSSQIP